MTHVFSKGEHPILPYTFHLYHNKILPLHAAISVDIGGLPLKL